MSTPFIHTHLHSEYSLVDSTIRIKTLIQACVDANMPAVALTDESNLFALIKFYRACMDAGIKPLCGSDIWIQDPGPKQPWRLTLLCQNHQGYLNLSALISRAWRDGQHAGRALVHRDWLTWESTTGLIALLGRESYVAHAGLNNDLADARSTLVDLTRCFDDDRLYLELTRCGREDEEKWNQIALMLASESQLPVLASNDVRFLQKQDFRSHEARVCIHQGRELDDPKRQSRYSEEQYLRSPDDMAKLFADLPGSLENTLELARRCNLEMKLDQVVLPRFPVDEGQDLDSTLNLRAQDGLQQRLNHTLIPKKDYQERLDLELGVITDMGFSGYFLIVADFINWAKEQGIPVGPGRGSGAGSLVAWSLKITDIDPLPLGLLFERFLNPERISMPDFDIDFCMDRRDEVIDYVTRKYGRDYVSQIITYGSMAAKAVLRDCGRVLGMPYGQVDKLAKLIPSRPLDLTLSDALGESEKAKQDPDRVVPALRTVFTEDEEAKALINLALKLENLTRNAGKHAGGVVISPEPLTTFTPLYYEPGGSVVTQYDKDDVEAVGLVKFDFLGLRTLTIIDWTLKAINTKRVAANQEALNISQLPLDDKASYALLQKAQTIAVFQLESTGMRRMLKDAKPDRFEDIVALVALYRPGPMDLIPTFIARKHGKEKIEYPDPRLEVILKETYGIMIYQEQVMQTAQIIGGYTLGGADLLRRAMGKKKVAEMARQRDIFRTGAAQNHLSGNQADAIFDLMEKFAGYGFNKSHAAAYALVAYQTAWLKTHYPAQFMAATMSSDMDNTDKVTTLIAEIRELNIDILAPDINTSEHKFVAQTDNTIRYGLGAIKGMGKNACQNIIEERHRSGIFHDLTEFCQRVDLTRINKRVLEAMIKAGAMDALAPSRALLMHQLPDTIKAAEQALRNRQSGQNDLFGQAISPSQITAQTSTHTIREWTLEDKLRGERDTLGHYLSGHPADPWTEELKQLALPLNKLPTPQPVRSDQHEVRRFQRAAERPWTVAGIVTSVYRRSDHEASVRLEDRSGQITVHFFDDTYTQYAPLLMRDALLVIEGSLRHDEFSPGGFQLRACHANTLDEIFHQSGQTLHLELGDITKDFQPALQKILTGHPKGHTKIRLEGYRITMAEADLELGEDWQVNASQALLCDLRSLAGVKSAHLDLVKHQPD